MLSALLVAVLVLGSATAAGAPVPDRPDAAGQRTVGAGFRWPLDSSPQVVRGFTPPPEPWLPGHRGVDLAGTPGQTVRSAGPGTVYFAGVIAGQGVVSVLHAGGLRTTYQPVQPLVRTGDAVRAGDPIGRLLAGHPGCPVDTCLHWGLRRGETYLDPLSLLGRLRVRLLPLDGGQP